jgi:succinyl-CoA synthetase beta subunit
MDIEEVAAEDAREDPVLSVDPATGVMPFHGRRIAFALGLRASRSSNACALMGSLYKPSSPRTWRCWRSTR